VCGHQFSQQQHFIKQQQQYKKQQTTRITQETTNNNNNNSNINNNNITYEDFPCHLTGHGVLHPIDMHGHCCRDSLQLQVLPRAT
jgi:hypothetical protein